MKRKVLSDVFAFSVHMKRVAHVRSRWFRVSLCYVIGTPTAFCQTLLVQCWLADESLYSYLTFFLLQHTVRQNISTKTADHCPLWRKQKNRVWHVGIREPYGIIQCSKTTTKTIGAALLGRGTARFRLLYWSYTTFINRFHCLDFASKDPWILTVIIFNGPLCTMNRTIVSVFVAACNIYKTRIRIQDHPGSRLYGVNGTFAWKYRSPFFCYWVSCQRWTLQIVGQGIFVLIRNNSLYSYTNVRIATKPSILLTVIVWSFIRTCFKHWNGTSAPSRFLAFMVVDSSLI